MDQPDLFDIQPKKGKGAGAPPAITPPATAPAVPTGLPRRARAPKREPLSHVRGRFRTAGPLPVRLEPLRQRRLECDEPAVRVFEPEAMRMQHQAGSAGGIAIERIAEDRVAGERHVDPQLMLPAGPGSPATTAR